MIHVITGAPCSGKSTYIRDNAKLGDLIIDLDEIANSLGVPDHDYSSTVKPSTLWEIRKELIADAIASKDEFDSWIVDTMLSGSYPEDADIVRLEIDKETAIERAKADGRPQKTFDGIERYFAEKKGNDMEHRFKSFEMKATDNGMIAGYFSTYDVEPDSYGDIIEKGAFTETIKKREESGHPFPLCFNHDFSAVIGSVKKVEDTEKGPYIEAEFLDTQLAQDVRKMLMSGAIYQFSFAYDVLQSRVPNEDEKKMGIANVLQKLEVFEISVVTVPANQNAVATEVKSVEPETKQGRRNRKADEDLITETIGQLDKCIESLKSLLEESEEDKPTEPDSTEEDTPENNEASEDSKSVGNSKRAEDLLSKINSIKGDS